MSHVLILPRREGCSLQAPWRSPGPLPSLPLLLSRGCQYCLKEPSCSLVWGRGGAGHPQDRNCRGADEKLPIKSLARVPQLLSPCPPGLTPPAGAQRGTLCAQETRGAALGQVPSRRLTCCPLGNKGCVSDLCLVSCVCHIVHISPLNEARELTGVGTQVYRTLFCQ